MTARKCEKCAELKQKLDEREQEVVRLNAAYQLMQHKLAQMKRGHAGFVESALQ